MILLDTNVILEPQRQMPDARVIKWIDTQALETLYLSTAELRAGIALPEGKRRDRLHENLEKRLLPMFANRVLPFNMACTETYADCWTSPARWDSLLKQRIPSLQPSPLRMALSLPPTTPALSKRQDLKSLIHGRRNNAQKV